METKVGVHSSRADQGRFGLLFPVRVPQCEALFLARAQAWESRPGHCGLVSPWGVKDTALCEDWSGRTASWWDWTPVDERHDAISSRTADVVSAPGRPGVLSVYSIRI